jgi:hypothetical protein
MASLGSSSFVPFGGFLMRRVLKTGCVLAIGFAVCGCADSSREQAASEPASKAEPAAKLGQPEPSAKVAAALNTEPVTAASIGPGKYVATIQGMS